MADKRVIASPHVIASEAKQSRDWATAKEIAASLRSSMKGTPPLSKLQRATLIVEPLQCGGEES
ncbi:hypothetical protein KO116_00951 [Halomonas sp. KO116]|nr:hypothetical protein KO116_00951 [Halomonas sp. KO116]